MTADGARPADGRRGGLRIAAAQTRSHPGDLRGAIAEHVELLAAAADQDARLVVFPELSLTGYEPELIDLHRLRVDPRDPALRPVATLCRDRAVHALIGAPTSSSRSSLPEISVLHVDPRGSITVVYRKVHLDIGEIGIFSAGTEPGRLRIDGWRLALASGREARIPDQLAQATQSGADVYVIGGLYLIGSEARLAEDVRLATATGLWAVLAQYSGGTGGGPAGGGSGIWAPNGLPANRLGAQPGVAVAEVSDHRAEVR